METPHTARRLRPETPPPPPGLALAPPTASPGETATQDVATFRVKRARQLTDIGPRPATPPPDIAPAVRLARRHAVDARRSSARPADWTALSDRLFQQGERDPYNGEALFAIARGFCTRHHAHLRAADISKLCYAYGRRHIDANGPAVPPEDRPSAGDLDFLATQLDALRCIDSPTLSTLILSLPAIVDRRDGSPALMAAMHRALEAASFDIASRDLGRIFNNLRNWADIVPSPERDALLALVATRLASANERADLGHRPLLNAMRATQALAPLACASTLLACITAWLDRPGITLNDSHIVSGSYMAQRFSEGTLRDRFLQVLARRIRHAAPASRIEDLRKVLRNLRRQPNNAAGDALIAALAPWIRNARCRLTRRELMVAGAGLRVSCGTRAREAVVEAIDDKLAEVDPTGIKAREAQRFLGRVTALPGMNRSPAVASVAADVLAASVGRWDLVGLSVACQAMAACPFDTVTPRFAAAIAQRMQALPEAPADGEKRLLTLILQSFEHLRDCDEGSDLAVQVARRIARLDTPPTPPEMACWCGALKTLGRTPGAYALADALLGWLRHETLADSQLALGSTLHASLAIPDSALARHVLQASVALIPRGESALLAVILQNLAIHPQPEQVADHLDAIDQRLAQLEEAGRLEDITVVQAVAAFAVLAPDRELPPCLTLRYEEATRSSIRDGRYHAVEAALAAEWRRATRQLQRDLGQQGEALPLQALSNHWYRGIEMDEYLPGVSINVEWDGWIHQSGLHARLQDEARDAFLRREGIDVVRIPVPARREGFNPQALVDQALQAVAAQIQARLAAARRALAGLQVTPAAATPAPAAADGPRPQPPSLPLSN